MFNTEAKLRWERIAIMTVEDDDLISAYSSSFNRLEDSYELREEGIATWQ